MNPWVDTLLHAWETQSAPPSELIGNLAMDDAYAIQQSILTRCLEAGKVHSGWKVGQTSAAMRAERGEPEPAPGFMLAENERACGGTLVLDDAQWFLEPELVLLTGESLSGPDVTAEDVRATVAGFAAGFELIRRQPGWDDRAVQRAVNGSTSGYVIGPSQPLSLLAKDVDDFRVECVCDDKVIASIRGGDVNDNAFETVAWLARFLHRYDRRLEAGHAVLTGTYAGLLPIERGQRWVCTIGTLDPVELHVAGEQT